MYKRQSQCGMRWTIAVVAMTGAMAGKGFAQVTGSECTATRTQPGSITQISDRMIYRDAALQNAVQHAQDQSDERPVPRMAVIDYKRAWVKTLLPQHALTEPNAVYFTLNNQNKRSSVAEVLNLPFSVYWCLAAPGDMVLLAGPAPHYTRIAAIDRLRGTIDLIDKWPEILLQFARVQPRAVQGPSATSVGGKRLVRFTMHDFGRLFVAAITLDTPQFADTVMNATPKERWTPDMFLALGLTLLNARDAPVISIKSAELLTEATRAAGRAGRQDLVDATAPFLFTAYALAHYLLVAKGDSAMADRALQYMTQIQDRYGGKVLDALDANAAWRIAAAAADARSVGAALDFCARAIAKDPNDRRAYLLRLRIATSQPKERRLPNRAAAAEQDADTVLRLIAALRLEFRKRQDDLKLRRGPYWEKGRTLQEVDQVELQAMAQDHALAVQLRGHLHAALAPRGAQAAPPAQP